MDPDLEAFERARANRETRTDPSTHTWVVQQKEIDVLDKLGRRTGRTAKIDGPVVPAPDSPHRARLRPMGTPAAPGARHKGVAADLARAYVAAHPEKFFGFEGVEIPILVQAVDFARSQGDLERVALIDCWLMATFAPFNVSGEVRI